MSLSDLASIAMIIQSILFIVCGKDSRLTQAR
jgi:hypothetical protein